MTQPNLSPKPKWAITEMTKLKFSLKSPQTVYLTKLSLLIPLKWISPFVIKIISDLDVRFSSEMMIKCGFICERYYIKSTCLCRISQHQHVYSSTNEYQRASLCDLQTKNYNLSFMRPKMLNLSSLLVICHQRSRLYCVLLRLSVQTSCRLGRLK